MISAIRADVEGREEDREKFEKVSRSIDEYFIALKPPQDFAAKSPNNAVDQIDLAFHNLCASLEDAGIHDPKNLSIYDLNVRLAFYNKKNKPR